MLSALFILATKPQNPPAVMWEPFLETPPDITFKVNSQPGKCIISNSATAETFETPAVPIINPTWSKSVHGDYWTKSVIVRNSNFDPAPGGLAIGEIIWYQNRLWYFIPIKSVEIIRIIGTTKTGALIENRWRMEGQKVYIHSIPPYDKSSGRMINGQAFPPTEQGDVFAERYGADGIIYVFRITGSEEFVASNVSYIGSDPSHIFLQNETQYDSYEYGPTYEWARNKQGNWVRGARHFDINNRSELTNQPSGNFSINYVPSCLSGNNLSYYDLKIGRNHWQLDEVASGAGLDWQLEAVGFKNGKLIVGKPNLDHPTFNPEIIGYLSIEGVTPGFKPLKR
jgi:hypothetical protein